MCKNVIELKLNFEYITKAIKQYEIQRKTKIMFLTIQEQYIYIFCTILIYYLSEH